MFGGTMTLEVQQKVWQTYIQCQEKRDGKDEGLLRLVPTITFLENIKYSKCSRVP